jgi:hypothetical protein
VATKKKVVKKKRSSTAKKTGPPAKKKTTARKSPAKKSTTKKQSGRNLPRELNEHGFVKGSDSEKVVEILLEGGQDRNDINEKIRKRLGGTTKNSTQRNVSSTVASILNKLRSQGYYVESSWKLCEPTPQSKAKATRAAKRAKSKTRG